LALFLVSAVTVFWWQIDQRDRALERVTEMQALYRQQVSAADALLAAGIAEEGVRKLLPDIRVQGGQAVLDAGTEARLLGQSRKRINQYRWEGGFFLLALGLGFGVIARVLSTEANVIKAQDSFLALVSHQFKTPLASLQLSLETMAMRPLAPDQQRTLI